MISLRFRPLSAQAGSLCHQIPWDRLMESRWKEIFARGSLGNCFSYPKNPAGAVRAPPLHFVRSGLQKLPPRSLAWGLRLQNLDLVQVHFAPAGLVGLGDIADIRGFQAEQSG